MTRNAPQPLRTLIAIVEDDPAVMTSLKFALELEGYAVAAFPSAMAALDGVDSSKADCLVIDFVLPDFDGLALLRSLRRRGVAAPAMIITSMPTARCRREAAEAGVPLLEKPLMGDSLGQHIRGLLDGRPGAPN